MSDYHAELRDWTNAGGVYFGYIYGDTKGRFVDGTYVRTSTALSVDENNILQTRNTRYKLVTESETERTN